MAHEADIELGLLRAQMQSGAYREALAFAAHTAGVHPDEVAGAAFYAWLLSLGGQPEVARQVWTQAQARAPGHALLREVAARWAAGHFSPGPVMSAGGHRMAPYASGEPVAAGARVVASGALTADGRHALVPLLAWQEGRQAWVRNGLGQTRSVRLLAQDEEAGVALLALSTPLPVAGSPAIAPRSPFAGTPVCAADYTPDPQGQAAWPVMRMGFLGRVAAREPAKQGLGVVLPGQGWRGGAVLDRRGRWLGLALGDGSAPASDRLLSLPALQARFAAQTDVAWGRPQDDAQQAIQPEDALYEQQLTRSLQLLWPAR